MNWALTTILCIVLIELLARLPLLPALWEIDRVARKAVRTLAAKRISDHWKERVLLVYARSLFVSSMKLAAVMAVAGMVAVIFVLASDSLGAAVGDFVASGTGLLFSLVVAALYFKIRKHVF
jgi:uncharacterized membrane-anchored protein